MAFSFGVAQPAKELRIPPRRRGKPKANSPVDLEKLERDFWQLFDLDKLASDWRRSLGGAER